MTTLFSTPTTLSPQAAWHARHGLMLKEYQHVHSLNRTGDRFVCANRAMTRWASADTEDAAEMAYCEHYGLPWWKLAEWNEAMMDREVLRVRAPEEGVFADEEMALG